MKKINEMDFKLGSKVYTDQKLSPEDVLKLTKLYLKPQPITKLIGKKLDQRVKVANDLASLTGRKQLEPDTKSGKTAQILVLLKSNLVSSDEYVFIFKKLIELHKQVYKYLSNASPELKGSSKASRVATKDMKGEFDESVNENISPDNVFKIYNKLKKGDVVEIKRGTDYIPLVVTKGKTTVGKQRVERITLQRKDKPNTVKYYLYNRNNKITLAIGDMGASIVDMRMVTDESITEEDQIKGGKADGKTLSDVANHHNVDIDQLMKEFQKGIKVEMEHTSDPKLAEEIALDHLWEMPDYYTKLQTIDPHESVNESTEYTDQTDMKSSILDSPKFSNIFRNASKELRWIRLPQVKIYKKGSGFVFTDGKREMVASYGDGDWKIIKNISNTRKEIKDLYKSSNESLTEATYNNKADVLTAYFKGKVTAQELSDIAKKQFGTSIATKKELSDFLKNKFTQDMMSDTYGIPAKTLVQRSRELIQFAENVNESTDEPQVIKDIRDVLENGYKNIKDPVSGKKMKMDSFTASHIIKVYDSLNPTNKTKYASQSLLKMSNIAFTLLKK